MELPCKKKCVWMLVIISALFLGLWCSSEEAQAARQVMLTYPDCPSTGMVITWRTDQPLMDPGLWYGTDSRWEYVQGVSRMSETLPDAVLHTVELTHLQPGTRYDVRIPGSAEMEERFSFRTLPPPGEEIVFLAGADSHVWPPGSDTSRRRAINAFAAEHDPDFVLLSGDIWYGDAGYDRDYGEGTTVGNVNRWFDDWHNYVVGPGNRRIPLVPSKGNHDRDYYDDLFQLPQHHEYYVLPIGPHITLITLGYIVTEEQTRWLEETLAAHQDSRWLIVQHHVSPYPSYLPVDEPYYGTTWITDAREQWVPLYEKYGVDVVITGHDHAYMRSHPIRNNRIDPAGPIYFISAAWSGGEQRTDSSRWFVDDTKSGFGGFFFRITLSADGNDLTIQPVGPRRTEPGFILSKRIQTEPFVVVGDQLRLKTSGDGGETIRVAVVDAQGHPLPGYDLMDSELRLQDSGEYQVFWGGSTLWNLVGQEVAFLIEPNEARLAGIRGDIFFAHVPWESSGQLYPRDGQRDLDPLTIAFSWADVANEYRLRIAVDPYFEELVLDQRLTEAAYAMDTLEYGRTYFWQVGAIADVRSDQQPLYQELWNPEGVQSFRTIGADFPPAQPELQVRSLLGKEVHLHWSPVNEINYYTLERQLIGDPGSVSTIAQFPRHAAEFRDLEVVPGEHYIYRLTGVNDLGPGSAASESIVVTPPVFLLEEYVSSQGFTNSWTRSGNWSFSPEGDGYVANLRGVFPTPMGSMRLDELVHEVYSMEIRFRVRDWGNQQFASLRIGSSMQERNLYQIQYWHMREELEFTRRSRDGVRELANIPLVLRANQWYPLKLVVWGEKLELFLDDVLIAAAVDGDPIGRGGVELHISNMDFDIDWIRVIE